MRDLGCELVVSIPISAHVLTYLVYVGCSIDVAGPKFGENLICLSHEGLVVILGMELLTTNHILIDYEQKNVVFPDATMLELSLNTEMGN